MWRESSHEKFQRSRDREASDEVSYLLNFPAGILDTTMEAESISTITTSTTMNQPVVADKVVPDVAKSRNNEATQNKEEPRRGARKRSETNRYTPDQRISSEAVPDELKSAKKRKVYKKKGASGLYINSRVAKAFNVDVEGERKIQIFFGTVDKMAKKTKPYIWHVRYDDDDEEEYDSNDLDLALEAYRKYQNADPRKKPTRQVKTESAARVLQEIEEKVEGQPQIGDRVIVRYAPSGLWYWGKVTNKLTKGNDLYYSIQYDDGDLVEEHRASDGIATEAQYEKGRPMKQASTSPSEKAPDTESGSTKAQAQGSQRPRRKAAPTNFVDLVQEESEEEDTEKAASEKSSEEEDSEAVIEIEEEEDDDSSESSEEPPVKRAKPVLTTKNKNRSMQTKTAVSAPPRPPQQADKTEEFIEKLVRDAIQDYDIPAPSESDLNHKESLNAAKREFGTSRLWELLKTIGCSYCHKKLGVYFKCNDAGELSQRLCSTCYTTSKYDTNWTISQIERNLGVTFLAVILMQDQIPPEHVEALSRLHTIDHGVNHQHAYRAYIKQYGHFSFNSHEINRAIYRRYDGVWAMHYAILKSWKNRNELGPESSQEFIASIEIERMIQKAVDDFPLRTSTSDRNLAEYLEPFKRKLGGSQAMLRRLKDHICHMDGCQNLGLYFSRHYASYGSSHATCCSCFKKNGNRVYEPDRYKDGDPRSGSSRYRYNEDQDWTPKQAEGHVGIEGFADYLEQNFPGDSRAYGRRAVFSGPIWLYNDGSICRALYQHYGGVAAIYCRYIL